MSNAAASANLEIASKRSVAVSSLAAQAETTPAPAATTPVTVLRSPSPLALAALEAGVSADDVMAYVAGRPAPVPAAQLRTLWGALSPDLREHNPDLRRCRIYLVSAQSWVTLGSLSGLEVACLIEALTTARFEVRYYANPGVSTRRFVSRSEAEAFAEGKRLYSKPATVKPIGGGL